ncbi:hypothetical protein CC2G_011163 [Coprinopsis cinerea AmutBmut pab1-1]|nr:hypothetical protein CC2G_011163 [Coprinopsis cinerea AmutBmut pab1-1]
MHFPGRLHALIPVTGLLSRNQKHGSRGCGGLQRAVNGVLTPSRTRFLESGSQARTPINCNSTLSFIHC